MTINVSVISHAFFTEKGSMCRSSQRIHHGSSNITDQQASDDHFTIAGKDKEYSSPPSTSRGACTPRDFSSPRSDASNVSSSVSVGVGPDPPSPRSNSNSSSSASRSSARKSQVKRRGNRKRGGRGKPHPSEKAKAVSDHPAKKHTIMVSGPPLRHVLISSSSDKVSGGLSSGSPPISSDDKVPGSLSPDSRLITLVNTDGLVSGSSCPSRHAFIGDNSKVSNNSISGLAPTHVLISSNDKVSGPGSPAAGYVPISGCDTASRLLSSLDVSMGNVDLLSGWGSSSRNALMGNVDMVSVERNVFMRSSDDMESGQRAVMSSKDMVSGERDLPMVGAATDIMLGEENVSTRRSRNSTGNAVMGRNDVVSNIVSCDDDDDDDDGATVGEAEVLMGEVSEECSLALGIVKEDLEFYGLCHLPRSMDRARLLKDKSGIMHVGVMVRNSELNVRNVEELVIQKDKAEHEAETYRLQIAQKSQEYEELRLKYDKLTEEVLHLRTMLTRTTHLRRESEKATELLRLEFEKLVKNLLSDPCSDGNLSRKESEERTS